MRLLDIYDLPVVDNPSSGDNIPGNIQTAQEYVAATNFNIVLILLCVFILIAVIFFCMYLVNKKNAKRLEQFTATNINEEEQNLINNFRKLNPQGKAIVNDTCKNLTDRGTTRKNENDGI
ncbi:MAG: hypothetical protein K2K38_04930 [Clostridia bacterium]|nr:hypothetical protein [Clostridia bacterium]